MDRSVTAKKTEDKTFTTFGQRDIHMLDIEEVTGMLAGQGCSYLAAIQLGDGDQSDVRFQTGCRASVSWA